MAGVVNCAEAQDGEEPLRPTYSVQGLDLDARYVRVRATGMRVVPEWHPAKDRKAWLFVDEILVNPQAPNWP